MAKLRFKLRRYNEGGFLDFLKKSPYQANALFTAASHALSTGTAPDGNSSFEDFSSEFAGNKKRAKGLEQGLDLASAGAAAIPGIGGIVSLGLQGTKAISSLTRADEDEFGVHKSGFLSGLDPQTELRKDRDRFQTSQLMSSIQDSNIVGSLSRNAVSGYKAAPYGRKGMKLSKFSKAMC